MDLFIKRVLKELLKLTALSLFVTGLTILFISVVWGVIDITPIMVVFVSFCGFLSWQPQKKITKKQITLHLVTGLVTLATFLTIKLSVWIAVVSVIFFPAICFKGRIDEAPLFRIVRASLILAGIGLGYAL